MLPIYQAQAFDKVLRGGSTYPWVVLVKVGGIDVPYVVKIYKKKHVDDTFCVAKDVYGSILATEFDLHTPSPALIEFTEYFINSLPIEMRKELEGKDERLKFGCKLIDGNFSFDTALHRDKIERYDIASIYAFDNLIYNGDRKEDKPNMLVKDKTIYLIDHELALSISQKRIDSFKSNTPIYNYKQHIFHNFLKHSTKQEKEEAFHTFESYLKDLNINILDDYYNQLLSLDHHVPDDYFIIKDYLCGVKVNPSKFVKILLGQIS